MMQNVKKELYTVYYDRNCAMMSVCLCSIVQYLEAVLLHNTFACTKKDTD